MAGLGEVSASGLAGETGLMVLDAPPASEAFRMGLRRGDVILRAAGVTVDSLITFKRIASSLDAAARLELRVTRNQSEITLVRTAP